MISVSFMCEAFFELSDARARVMQSRMKKVWKVATTCTWSHCNVLVTHNLLIIDTSAKKERKKERKTEARGRKRRRGRGRGRGRGWERERRHECRVPFIRVRLLLKTTIVWIRGRGILNLRTFASPASVIWQLIFVLFIRSAVGRARLCS